jgi:hypothetical protein
MRQRLISALLVVLAAGLLCLAWLLALPGGPASEAAMGISQGRLALAVALGLLWLALAVFLWGVWRGDGPGARLLTWLENLADAPAQALWSVQASVFAAALCLGVLLLYRWIDPQAGYQAVFLRLLPAALWGLVLALLTAWLCWPGVGAAPGGRTGALLAAFVLGMGLLVFFWLAARLFAFTIDDAYITFRYARNLADGLGPTYNPAPPRAEGYSTFLWMLLMILPHRLGLEVALAAKGLGMLATLGTSAVLYGLVIKLDRHSRTPHLFAALAVFFLAAFPPTAVHAVAGMETALFTFLLLAMAAGGVFVVQVGGSGWSLPLLPILGLLLGLARPEGNLAAAGILLACGGLLPPAARRRLGLYTLLLYFLPGLVYFAWRWWYYGVLLPLPFYFKAVKAGRPLAGAGDVGVYLLNILPPVGLLLAGAAMRARRELLVLVAPAALLLGFYLVPAHVLGFNWRFVYPTATLVYALAGYGAGALVGWLPEAENRRADRLRLALLALGLALLGLVPLAGAGRVIETSQRYARDVTARYTRLGQSLAGYLQENPGAERPTLALADAGILPYYSGWRTIDTLGLNDVHLALMPASVDTAYLMAQEPDLLVVASQRPDELVREGRTQVAYGEALLQAGMQPLKVIRLAPDTYLWLLAYPDGPVAEYLRAALADWE